MSDSSSQSEIGWYLQAPFGAGHGSQGVEGECATEERNVKHLCEHIAQCWVEEDFPRVACHAAVEVAATLGGEGVDEELGGLGEVGRTSPVKREVGIRLRNKERDRVKDSHLNRRFPEEVEGRLHLDVVGVVGENGYAEYEVQNVNVNVGMIQVVSKWLLTKVVEAEAEGVCGL